VNINKPLGAGLFFYECLRLIILVSFLVSGTFESAISGSTVFMGSSALFPLMTLFIWLRPGEYRNYITLYIAGKLISFVSFYSWGIPSLVQKTGAAGGAAVDTAFLGIGILFSLADMLFILAAWVIKKNTGGTPAPESGGA